VLASIIGIVVENAIYGGMVAAVGFGLYRGVSARASVVARWVVAALGVAAVVFCIVIVTWDYVAGTETSTESFIVFIAAVPLAVAVGLVALVDALIRQTVLFKRPR
jgi:hypothetical protein